MTRSFAFSLLFSFLLSLSSSVWGQTINYCATLTPVPQGQGSGSAQLVYNETDHSLSISIQFSGVTSAITNSHIHACTAVPLTGTASPATAVNGLPFFPSSTSGNYQQTLNLLNPTEWNNNFITSYGNISAAETGLLSCLSSGRAYINLHNPTFLAGEISGFFQSSNCGPATTTSAPTTKPSNIIRQCSDSVCSNNGTCSSLPYYPFVKCACLNALYSGVFCTVLGKSSPRITFTINKDIRFVTDEFLFRNTIINEVSVASGASLDRITLQEMALTDTFDKVRVSVTISPAADPLSVLSAEEAIRVLQAIMGNPSSRLYTDRNVVYLASVDLESITVDSCPYGLGNTVCSTTAINSLNSFDSVDDWEAASSIGVAVGLLIMLVFFGLLFVPRLGVICRPRTDAEKEDYMGEEYQQEIPHTPVPADNDDDAERAPWQSPKGKGGGKGSFSYQA